MFIISLIRWHLSVIFLGINLIYVKNSLFISVINVFTLLLKYINSICRTEISFGGISVHFLDDLHLQ